MTTSSIRAGQPQLFGAQTQISDKDEKATQQAALEENLERADVVDSARAKHPTLASAAEAMKLAMADLRAQQAYAALQKLVPGGAPDATEAPRLSLSESGELNVRGTDANDVIQVDGSGDDWEISALQNGEQVFLGSVAKSQVKSVNVEGGAGDDVLLGFGLDGSAALQGGAGSDSLISIGLGGAAAGKGGPILVEGADGGSVYNEVDGALIDGGAGANAILNRGKEAIIGPKAGVLATDLVINEGDDTSIQYDTTAPQRIHQFANRGSIGVAGSGSVVGVVGDENALALSGDDNQVRLQGQGNAAVLPGKGNAVIANGAKNTAVGASDDFVSGLGKR